MLKALSTCNLVNFFSQVLQQNNLHDYFVIPESVLHLTLRKQLNTQVPLDVSFAFECRNCCTLSPRTALNLTHNSNGCNVEWHLQFAWALSPMIAHYVCNTLYLPLSLFLYPFYIEYKGSFVSTTGRRRRLGRPHKLYIFIISINNRVDIAMSIYAFVCMKLEISEQYRVYYSRVHSTVAFLLVLSLWIFLSLFPSFSLFLSPGGHLQLASCHGCRCCVLQNPTASLQTWRLSDCHKLCSNFCMSSYALFLARPASPPCRTWH